jgi:hypothetical protein
VRLLPLVYATAPLKIIITTRLRDVHGRSPDRRGAHLLTHLHRQAPPDFKRRARTSSAPWPSRNQRGFCCWASPDPSPTSPPYAQHPSCYLPRAAPHRRQTHVVVFWRRGRIRSTGERTAAASPPLRPRVQL